MTDKKSHSRSHEHKLNIEASPEAVWKAITTAEELVKWFPLQAESEPGAGGKLTYRWGETLEGVCKIETWEPSRHLRTTWMEGAELGDVSESGRRQVAVDWCIEAKGGGTVLRLVHSGFSVDASWDEEYDATRRGWDVELRSLKHYLEHHAGRKRKVFWLRQPVSLSASQTWQRFTGPEGLIREGRLDSLGAGDRYRMCSPAETPWRGRSESTPRPPILRGPPRTTTRACSVSGLKRAGARPLRISG